VIARPVHFHPVFEHHVRGWLPFLILPGSIPNVAISYTHTTHPGSQIVHVARIRMALVSFTPGFSVVVKVPRWLKGPAIVVLLLHIPVLPVPLAVLKGPIVAVVLLLRIPVLLVTLASAILLATIATTTAALPVILLVMLALVLLTMRFYFFLTNLLLQQL
jgi:hypothetical protein